MELFLVEVLSAARKVWRSRGLCRKQCKQRASTVACMRPLGKKQSASALAMALWAPTCTLLQQQKTRSYMVPQAEIPGENAVRGLSKDPKAHWHSWRSSDGEREREGGRERERGRERSI